MPPRTNRLTTPAAALAGLLLAGATGVAAAQPAAGRVQPPDDTGCPRDHLTVYIGAVQRYQRGAGRTTLRIRTDEATTETVTIKHPGADGPGRWFLIERQPFTAGDWARIEKAPGRLHPGMRAAAWVCDDGRNPVVDWQPPHPP